VAGVATQTSHLSACPVMAQLSISGTVINVFAHHSLAVGSEGLLRRWDDASRKETVT
jgi:hypothetical protein